MRIQLVVLATGLLAACGPNDDQFDFSGTEMPAYFPFDGTRSWDFISTENTVSFKYVAQMRSSEPDVIDGVNTYPVDYIVDCVQNDPECVDLSIARTLQWASDEVDGVFIYEWIEGATTTTFDPPLMIADTKMKLGDSVTTETGGATWTSTLVAFESCPVRFASDLGQCARFTIDDGDNNPQTGVGLAGDYWAAVGYNVVGIQLVGDPGVWELSKNDCVPLEECDGVW